MQNPPSDTAGWVRLLSANAHILRKQGWSTTAGTRKAEIRNEQGQCPLCALASILAPENPMYREVWHVALRKAFQVTTVDGAFHIAMAADSTSRTNPLRKALITILGAKP